MSTIVHAVIGYFYLLLTVRVLGRRPGAQLTPFEFVLVMLIGGVIILTTVGNERSEINAVCAVITVALIHRLLSTLAWRYEKFSKILYGVPLVLLKEGRWQTEILQSGRVDEMDVMAAARNRGVKNLAAIKYAVLERQGGISIIEKEDASDPS